MQSGIKDEAVESSEQQAQCVQTNKDFSQLNYADLAREVDDLAINTVLKQPMPLMLSFSLLSYEECSAAFDEMVCSIHSI
jgi:hypothetical protein